MNKMLGVVLGAMLLIGTGCGSSPTGDKDGAGGDGVPGDAGDISGEYEILPGDLPGDAPGSCKEDPSKVCCPGDTNGCSEDFRSILTCKEDGSGWDLVECIGDDGQASLCIVSPDAPTGYCASCIPGKRKCQDDDVALQCDQVGKGWEFYLDCNGAQTGQICLEGGCVKLCDLNDKWKMYMGCDFWGVDLDNAFVPGGRSGYYDAAGSQYAIVVSNPHPKYPADVKVYIKEAGEEVEVLYDSKDEPLPSGPLGPGELRIFNLPRRDADGTILAPLAYRVAASIPITAYQFNPLENVDVFSNDASLLIPSNVLGKYYFVMTREQTFDELRSYFTVVAVRSGQTEVTVDFTASTLVGENANTGEPIVHYEPGQSAKFTLEQYDVLNIETDKIGADMTGTRILANRDVAVFGGSEASNAPNTNHCLVEEGVCEWDEETTCKDNSDCIAFNTCCADHLEHQLFPVKSWGLRYLASKLYPRKKEKDVYRIIAAEANTQVTTIPPQVNIPVLNQGEWVDFESAENFEIIAKKPIMVGQFMAAQDAPDPNVNGVPQPNLDAGIGDPAFILLVPNEQTRQDYVILAPNKYELDYISIVAPVDEEGTVVNVWYDCKEIDPKKIADACTPLDPDDFELFGTGEFATAKFQIEDGVHRVYAEKPVALYVYGYDQYVSYGYAAGLNIADLGLIKEPGEQ